MIGLKEKGKGKDKGASKGKVKGKAKDKGGQSKNGKSSKGRSMGFQGKGKGGNLAKRAAMCVASKAILLEIVDRWCAMLQQVLPQGPLLQIGQL